MIKKKLNRKWFVNISGFTWVKQPSLKKFFLCVGETGCSGHVASALRPLCVWINHKYFFSYLSVFYPVNWRKRTGLLSCSRSITVASSCAMIYRFSHLPSCWQWSEGCCSCCGGELPEEAALTITLASWLYPSVCLSTSKYLLVDHLGRCIGLSAHCWLAS